MKKIYRIGYGIFVAAILLIGVLLALTLFPIKNNIQIKVVQSGSMEPEIKTGSVVIIKPENTYKVGDIVTFGKDTKTDVPTTHRIIESRAIEGTLLFKTKGDANEDADAHEISSKEIIGKVVLDVPFVGYLIAFARKPLGFLLIIILPALIIVGDEIIKIWKEVSRLRRKKTDLPNEQSPQ